MHICTDKHETVLHLYYPQEYFTVTTGLVPSLDTVAIACLPSVFQHHHEPVDPPLRQFQQAQPGFLLPR